MELTFIELENFQVDRKKKMLPNACYVKKGSLFQKNRTRQLFL